MSRILHVSKQYVAPCGLQVEIQESLFSVDEVEDVVRVLVKNDALLFSVEPRLTPAYQINSSNNNTTHTLSLRIANGRNACATRREIDDFAEIIVVCCSVLITSVSCVGWFSQVKSSDN